MKILDGESLVAEWGVDHFKTGSTMGALSDEAVRFLLGRGRVLSLADGEELFHTGDPADSFFVLLRGQLDTFREQDGEKVPILTIAFGEQIGYVSMIGLFQRLGDGRAHGPTVLLEINSDVFYQMHMELPFDFGILMLNLSREMARGFRKVATGLVDACAGHHVA
jgi:CRP-like cAMP-binding protein